MERNSGGGTVLDYHHDSGSDWSGNTETSLNDDLIIAEKILLGLGNRIVLIVLFKSSRGNGQWFDSDLSEEKFLRYRQNGLRLNFFWFP